MPRSPDGVGEDREAIRLKPDYAAAFNNRGVARRAKRRPIEGAGDDFKEAERLKAAAGAS